MIKKGGESKIGIPRIGMRIIKTSISLFLCFLIFILRGEKVSPLYALMAAIISMQTDVENSIKAAANRTIGTFIGGLIGTIVLIIVKSRMMNIPNIYTYIVISVSIIPVIYLTILVKRPGSTAIACTVFVVITTSTNVVDPLLYSINRIVDTLVGIFVSLFVNLIRMPRFNKKKFLFVMGLESVLLKAKPIPTATTIKLNQVISRRGIVTIASENSPSLFLDSVREIGFKYPIIVMNGSAIYDISEKSFLKTWEIERETYEKLNEIIEKNEFHAFVRSVKNGMLCVFYKDFTNIVQQEIFEIQNKMSDKFYIFGELPENYQALNLLVTDTEERINILVEHIRNADIDVKFHIASDRHNDGYFHLNIYHKSVSKGTALQHLKEILEVDGVVAFGAADSDIAMLSVADKSFALTQSPDEVKSVADEIISSKNDNISRKIRKIFLYGLK